MNRRTITTFLLGAATGAAGFLVLYIVLERRAQERSQKIREALP